MSNDSDDALARKVASDILAYLKNHTNNINSAATNTLAGASNAPDIHPRTVHHVMTDEDRKMLAAALNGHDYSNRFVRLYYLMPEHTAYSPGAIPKPGVITTNAVTPGAESKISGGHNVADHDGLPATPTKPPQTSKSPQSP